MRVQTSSNIDIWRHSNGHISVLRNATVMSLGLQVVLRVLCTLMWPWPEPRSRSRSRTIWTSDNCPKMYISTYISSATFAWSSKLTVDIDSMGPILQLLGGQFSNFLLGKVSLEFKLHGMSIFHDIQMATYFGTEWCYSHMVGFAGSPTYTAYVDVTLTLSKVKVTGLLNFRQPVKPCMLAAMTAAPLRGFLVTGCMLFLTPNQQCQSTKG